VDGRYILVFKTYAEGKGGRAFNSKTAVRGLSPEKVSCLRGPADLDLHVLKNGRGLSHGRNGKECLPLHLRVCAHSSRRTATAPDPKLLPWGREAGKTREQVCFHLEGRRELRRRKGTFGEMVKDVMMVTQVSF